MRFYLVFNKIQNCALIPFIISSIFLAFAELFKALGNVFQFADVLLFNIGELLTNMTPYVFCFFIVIYFAKGRRIIKSFWSIFCLLIINVTAGGTGSTEMSIVVGIAFSLFAGYVLNNVNWKLSYALMLIFSLLLGLIIPYLNDYLINATMYIASFASGKGSLSAVLFGGINSIFELFDSELLGDMFYYKSYGGAFLVNDNVVTGIKDLFDNGYSGALISTYLSGHYYILFVIGGIMLFLTDKLKSWQKITMLIVGAAAILSGNISIFLLFIFLESPFLYLAYLLLAMLAYLVADLLQLQMGFIFSGGFVEMLFNLNKAVYLIVGGLIFMAVGYFSARFVFEKRGFSDSLNNYIPTRFNSIIKALGGVINIIRLGEDYVEVRNPNLVNVIGVDTDIEIKENHIYINTNIIDELKEYIE